ncbi:MAG: tRNA (adenosine(37)-N6)-threonylcarbamoyltransferase complex dimerization subunit type 1 TsaB [Hominimerdicola sp.]
MNDLKILGIDTSGKIASVAITDGDRVLWEKSVYTKLTHSQVILPMVKQALEECELDFADLDCVAAANGPGSYTGLRIGIGAVKGMCLGCQGLKCAGVSTLLALAYNNVSYIGKIVAVMKARPKVVYVGVFQSDGEKICRIDEDKIADEEEFFTALRGEKFLLTGDYAKEIKEKYFTHDSGVICACPSEVLQKASSVCLAVLQNPQIITDGDNLEVSYLQATKAEKDKAHRN